MRNCNCTPGGAETRTACTAPNCADVGAQSPRRAAAAQLPAASASCATRRCARLAASSDASASVRGTATPSAPMVTRIVASSRSSRAKPARGREDGQRHTAAPPRRGRCATCDPSTTIAASQKCTTRRNDALLTFARALSTARRPVHHGPAGSGASCRRASAGSRQGDRRPPGGCHAPARGRDESVPAPHPRRAS